MEWARHSTTFTFFLSLIFVASIAGASPSNFGAVAISDRCVTPSTSTDDAVFIPVPPDLEPGSRHLAISYALGETELAHEGLTFEVPSENSRFVVELLSANGEQRGNLLRLSATHPLGVDVILSFEGMPPYSVSLQRVARETRDLLAEGWIPLSLKPSSAPGTAAPVTSITGASSTACHTQCQDEFDDCIYNRCDYQSDPCDFCYEEAEECGFQCDCPTYIDETKTSRVLVRRLGASTRWCGQDINYPHGGVEYESAVARNRYSVVRTTTYCDHTTSTEVISVSYGPEYSCDYWTSVTCANPLSTTPSCIVYDVPLPLD